MAGGRALIWTAPAAALLAGAAVLRASPGPGDYGHRHSGPFDDAGPVIDALLDGRVGDAPAVQPLMGLVSVIWRLPFAAIGRADGIVAEYRLGAFACLWVLATIGLLAALAHWRSVGARGAADRGGAAFAIALAVGLLAFGPMTAGAMDAGHPEELLLAGLATGGVWAVASGRVGLGAVLVGLAIGTKPFGLFAWLAALVAAPAHARKTTLTAAAVAAPAVLALPLLDPSVPLDLARDLSDYRRVFPVSLWWVAGHDQVLLQGVVDPIRLMPDGLTRGSGTLAAALFAVVACAGVWRARRGAALGRDALALLATLFLARAALDPLNLEYYAVPGIAALVAWELLARERPPLIAALIAIAGWPLFHSPPEPALTAALFALWAMAPIAFLLVRIHRS